LKDLIKIGGYDQQRNNRSKQEKNEQLISQRQVVNKPSNCTRLLQLVHLVAVLIGRNTAFLQKD